MRHPRSSDAGVVLPWFWSRNLKLKQKSRQQIAYQAALDHGIIEAFVTYVSIRAPTAPETRHIIMEGTQSLGREDGSF